VVGDHEWHWLHLNPEPWTAPSAARGRGERGIVMYKNERLRVYQEAVREELGGRNLLIFDPGTPIEVDFYYWRALEPYRTDSDRVARAHEADTTNLNKALEDALQGILFENDRDCKRVQGWIVEQGFETEPLIGIRIGLLKRQPELEVVPPARPAALEPGNRSHLTPTRPDGMPEVEELF
jgi:Holliday junction resolvase RusA-like endonuclease